MPRNSNENVTSVNVIFAMQRYFLMNFILPDFC